MDKLLVTIIGILLIGFIYWFFLLNDTNEDETKKKRHDHH